MALGNTALSVRQYICTKLNRDIEGKVLRSHFQTQGAESGIVDQSLFAVVLISNRTASWTGLKRYLVQFNPIKCHCHKVCHSFHFDTHTCFSWLLSRMLRAIGNRRRDHIQSADHGFVHPPSSLWTPEVVSLLCSAQ